MSGWASGFCEGGEGAFDEDEGYECMRRMWCGDWNVRWAIPLHINLKAVNAMTSYKTSARHTRAVTSNYPSP